jgi:hypothetical protein
VLLCSSEAEQRQVEVSREVAADCCIASARAAASRIHGNDLTLLVCFLRTHGPIWPSMSLLGFLELLSTYHSTRLPTSKSISSTYGGHQVYGRPHVRLPALGDAIPRAILLP